MEAPMQLEIKKGYTNMLSVWFFDTRLCCWISTGYTAHATRCDYLQDMIADIRSGHAPLINPKAS